MSGRRLTEPDPYPVTLSPEEGRRRADALIRVIRELIIEHTPKDEQDDESTAAGRSDHD